MTPTKSASTTPKAGLLAHLSADLPASIVVFLVAVPLALGIALASGAPIMAGLIACAVGGLVVGVLGGAPLQVSGPAAGLTVLVFGMVQQFGWQVTCAITVAAGLLQLAFGALRIARACLAISPAVVHGMLAGIGVVISLAQIHIVLGGKPQSSALINLRELPGQIATLHTPAAFVGLMTIGIMLAWKYVPAKLKVIPGALAAVGLATIVSGLFNLNVTRVDLPEKLTSAFALPQLPNGNWSAFAIAAVTLAIVASVESLLCAVATDKLHTGPRANLDKELIGQGAANTISGLIGGLPVTGVIVRSAANITAGAKTRTSGILHGIWIILAVALFARGIEWIPLASLAGLLVFVGVNLVKIADIKEMIHKREAPIYFATMLGVAFWNLLGGVMLGIGLAVVLLLRRLSRTEVRVEEKEGRWHVQVQGVLSFMSVPKLSAALEVVPPGAEVDVDLMVDYIDHAALEALHSWRQTYEKLGGKVDIDELHELWYQSQNGSSSSVRKDGEAAAIERAARRSDLELARTTGG